MDFGAEIPVDRLEIPVRDQEFARDVHLEAETVKLPGQQEFYPILFNEDTALAAVVVNLSKVAIAVHDTANEAESA